MVMDESEYEQMYKLESFYWWFVARRKLVHDFVHDCKCPKDGTLLDVGCGTETRAVLHKWQPNHLERFR
jgi:hypothetical protein